MWSYTDDEQAWLEPKVRQMNNTRSGQDYLPEYYIPAPELTVDFYRQRAHALRNEAIGSLFASLAENAGQFLRQLGELSSGDHGKVEAVINELRRGTPKRA